MGNEKERIDVLLVEQGLFATREKAKAAVMAGTVYLGTERVEKPGSKVPRSSVFIVKGAAHPYVSRGGLKLEKALETFNINLHGRVMLDIGASTGGFTDCALKRGAAYVYALDVGYNQLAWSIRNDPRVKVMERTNFRYAEPAHFVEPTPDFATIDVSFISLELMLRPLAAILPHGEERVGECVALIKPQFEAGSHKVGKSGVVRESAVHREVIERVFSFAEQNGFYPKGLTYSPITGGEGNIEFLVYWTLNSNDQHTIERALWEELISRTVEEAANRLNT